MRIKKIEESLVIDENSGISRQEIVADKKMKKE